MESGIFRAYDIRGLSPQELNAQDAKRIAQAIVAVFKPSSVVVGRDMRITSEELENAIVAGFLSSGVNVTKIGLCSTPLFNFAIGSSSGRYDLGVMVTASHNPGQYNGLKITKGDNSPVGQGMGLEELRERAMSQTLSVSESQLHVGTRLGKLAEDVSVLKRYVAYLLERAHLSTLPLTKIAIDAGNGMAGFVLPELASNLMQVKFEKLYWNLDGNFPNHEANPLKSETMKDLRTRVVRTKCSFGAAFDGDADRVGIVDEEGEIVPSSILTALIAKEILRDHPGAHILYDLRSSRIVAETVEESGGTSEMTRVGHAFVKKSMKESGAIFAGEVSMHFYFQDFWNCESGDFAMLIILRMLLREGKPLSALWRPLKRYHHSGEVNFKVDYPAEAIVAVENAFQDQKPQVSHLDGLRMDWEDSWFNVRPSNTEPLLRLNAETRSDKETRLLVEKIEKVVKRSGGIKL